MMEIYRLFDSMNDEIAMLKTTAEPEEFKNARDEVKAEIDAFSVTDLVERLREKNHEVEHFTPKEVRF